MSVICLISCIWHTLDETRLTTRALPLLIRWLDLKKEDVHEPEYELYADVQECTLYGGSRLWSS